MGYFIRLGDEFIDLPWYCMDENYVGTFNPDSGESQFVVCPRQGKKTMAETVFTKMLELWGDTSTVVVRSWTSEYVIVQKLVPICKWRHRNEDDPKPIDEAKGGSDNA